MALFKNDKNENKNQISWRKITTRQRKKTIQEI